MQSRICEVARERTRCRGLEAPVAEVLEQPVHCIRGPRAVHPGPLHVRGALSMLRKLSTWTMNRRATRVRLHQPWCKGLHRLVRGCAAVRRAWTSAAARRGSAPRRRSGRDACRRRLRQNPACTRSESASNCTHTSRLAQMHPKTKQKHSLRCEVRCEKPCFRRALCQA